MTKNGLKLKKGGVDTVVAYVVVMIPLVYVLIFMVATLYHFTIQMYMNQVVKEALVMASTYGTLTQDMENYMLKKVDPVVGGNSCSIRYYVRRFQDNGTVASRERAEISRGALMSNGEAIEKGDLIGISLESNDPSLLQTVSNFSLFGHSTDATVKYAAYREEIVRNEAP